MTSAFSDAISDHGGNEMRKSAAITLVIAIVLIVIGVGLSVYGIYLDSPHGYIRSFDHGFVSYHVRYVTSGYGSGHAAATFGHMLFNGGLVALVISFILNLHRDKEDREVREKERKADRAEAEKARAEAIDATVHEEGSKDDSTSGD